MRVRANATYTFHPCGLDLYMPAHQGLVDGDKVKVVALPGCPPPNTMGMCHVFRDGEFMGLVSCDSLMKEN